MKEGMKERRNEGRRERRKDPQSLSWKRGHGMKTHEGSWREQKYDSGSRRGPKPRMTVLAKASSKFLL
jgi:hypothetical protein